jgi:small subunit ribosomal protein S17
MAHDEQNQCKAGDLVLLEESPPYSRHKKWTLKEVLKYTKNKIFRVKPKNKKL